MKKFVLILSCLLVLYSSFLDVYAEDDTQYYGTFNGNQYPIIYSNPDIMPVYDINGFTVSSQYKDDSGSYVSFNQSVSLPNTNERTFYVQIVMPNIIEKNRSFDISFGLNFNDATVTFDEVITYNASYYGFNGKYSKICG